MRKTLCILIIGMTLGHNILPFIVHVIQHVRIVKAKTTGYCACEKCCGEHANGITSTGRDAKKTRGVAIDTKVFN